MRLLVSVRAAAEVAPALAGGADIVDAKEPARGSLGAVSREVLREIAALVPATVPLSVALGDFTAERRAGDAVRESLVVLDGFPRRAPLYLKLGFAGQRSPAAIAGIIAAAIEVADAEGLGALSMRRVAERLGVGTMSLYRYVPGKGELLDLMLDRVQNPSENPADVGDGDWRSALEALGRATLDLYRRHPWLLQVNQTRPILGPSALDGMEKVLTLIRPMGLTDPELISAIIMIDGYVIGAARTQLYYQEAERRTGLTDAEFWQAQAPILEKVLASGRYPAMASLSEDAFGSDFDHFEFGLQRILDGLEVFVARRGEG
jgi:AcrR family transcriptional regulator